MGSFHFPIPFGNENGTEETGTSGGYGTRVNRVYIYIYFWRENVKSTRDDTGGERKEKEKEKEGEV